MAGDRPPWIYLCASEWLALLMGEDGAHAVRTLVERSSAGQFDIVGSELLYVEVLAPSGDELLSAGVRTWASLDHRVALRAREFRLRALEDGRSIKGMTPDIIHIATAAIAGVEAFITNDKACRSLAEHFELEAYDRASIPVMSSRCKAPRCLWPPGRAPSAGTAHVRRARRDQALRPVAHVPRLGERANLAESAARRCRGRDCQTIRVAGPLMPRR